MAAVSEVLLLNCDFRSVTQHAASFCRLLFTANFRSLYTWDKVANKNKREDTDNDGLMTLHKELRMFIAQERAKHIRHFAVEVATNDIREKPVRYDPVVWMDKFRKLFTNARMELFKKTVQVRLTNIKYATEKHLIFATKTFNSLLKNI